MKLAAHFPAAFKDEGQPVPLKIGIDKDLIAALPGTAEHKIQTALRYYTRKIAYQECLVEGADRVDLTGAPAGKVTAFEASRAKHLVARVKRAQSREETIKSLLRALKPIIALEKGLSLGAADSTPVVVTARVIREIAAAVRRGV